MRTSSPSAHSQRLRLLEQLKKGAVTTLFGRHELDILGVAPRVFELRHEFGFNIKTYWDYGENPGSGGGRHRVARYVLLPGKYNKKAEK